MAGRPKTMAKRVDCLEVAAFQLVDAILQTIPEQYQADFEKGDLVGQAWNESYNTAADLWMAIGDLGELLRKKAGIKGEGPTEKWELVRRERTSMPDDLDFDLLEYELELLSVSENDPGDNSGVSTDKSPAGACERTREDEGATDD